MQDYRLKKSDNPNYVLDVKVRTGQNSNDKTLEIKFADGTIFKNIYFNKENLKKVNDILEKQAKTALEDFDKFKLRKKVSEKLIASSPIVGSIIGATFTSITEKAGLIDDPVALGTMIGTITLTSMLPFIYISLKYSSKVGELRKIKYRNEHKEILESYTEHENSLAGLPEEKQSSYKTMQEKGLNPFDMTNIDFYTKKDLESIVTNIEREKTYTFSYLKKNN